MFSRLIIKSESVDWMTYDSSTGTAAIQGRAALWLNGEKSRVVFKVAAKDNGRNDEIKVVIYETGKDPDKDAPIYKIDQNVRRGFIKIK